jgi:hypothetical protein
VPAPGGRRGRRDNGLVAARYEAVGDLDPRIGEHLLDVLAAGGIAAYLQPTTDLHPITRTTSLPARPTDRLYVDRDHLDTARDYIDQVTTGPDHPGGTIAPAAGTETAASTHTVAAEPGTEPDVEAAWREIVAGFYLTAQKSEPRVAAPEVTLDEPWSLPQIEPPDPTAELWTGRRADPVEPSLLDALDTFGATLPADDDAGYTPPPPPPLPRISAAATLGVAGIVLGLLLFVWPDLLPLTRNVVLLLAFGSVVAGFGTLIWRLRSGDEDDDDFDDGARI